MLRELEFPDSKSSHAFTLIELIIVVAIISILAAIAVPNFLEAQVRAKTSRVKNDLRTVAVGIEAYAVDTNHYPPNDGYFNVIPLELTTPIAYLSNNFLVDPFCEQETNPRYGILVRFYTYDKIVTFDELMDIMAKPNPKAPPVEAVDSDNFNLNARKKYGLWRLVSNGPDRLYSDPNFVFGSDPLDPNGVLMGSDVVYDPTNGSMSLGNIIRTQKEEVKR